MVLHYKVLYLYDENIDIYEFDKGFIRFYYKKLVLV